MKPRDAWSDFWASASDEACLPNAPAAVRTALGGHWTSFARTLPRDASVLDIASGNGAVLRVLHGARDDLEITGIDYAEVGARARDSGIRGGVDATGLPFDDQSFDSVVSQFGIEYCPVAALDEAVRVLRPGGALRLVVHHVASPALAHNRRRAAAIAALDSAGLFALARAAVAGLPVNGQLARAVAEARRCHASQPVVEELPVAVGLALRRPGAVAAINTLQARARGEVARLAAMEAAARDADAIATLVARLFAAGCEARAAALLTASGEVVAWRVEGNRI